MSRPRHAPGGRTLTALAVAVCVVAAAGAVAPPVATADDVIVVDADGGADYRSIDAAVDAAADGDTVRVRPGTYRERVTLRGGVDLVAPRGATLDGRAVTGDVSSISLRDDTHRGVAISIPEGSDAAPVIAGFRVRGYLIGVDASDTTGDWTVRNLTIRNVTFGVHAPGATGDWTVRNTTVRDVTHFEAVDATGATGDWTLAGVTLRNVLRGVDASSTTGAWVMRTSTVDGVPLVAVDAAGAEAAWRLRDVTIDDATVGLRADGTGGDWTVRNAAFRNLSRSDRYDFRRPSIPEGTAVYARGATGAWTVADSRFAALDGPAVVATGAVPGGTTTGNRFDGRATPGAAVCRGNVTCAEAADARGRDGPATDAVDDAPNGPGTTTGNPEGDPGTTTGAAGTAGPSDAADATDADDATGVRVPLSPIPAVLALLAFAALVARRARR